MEQGLARKLVLIGWDAADWKFAGPLIDRGLMPNLAGLVDGGVMGGLRTLHPILSPMLWNSIATGMRPGKHGIHWFTEPDPRTGGIRPVTSTSRKVKAIWNILSQSGYRTHVVNWFASHPAEPISGACVSNLYPHPCAPAEKPWPVPQGAVHPARLSEALAALRVHPQCVRMRAVQQFVPNAANVDPEKDRRINALPSILAEELSVHNAATWLMRNEPWDFTAIYYGGIDHFGHGFMNFHPPRMEGVPEELFETYQHVMTEAYRLSDWVLGEVLDAAGPGTTTVLVSDHGFHSDHLRPRTIPKEPAGPAVQHRPFGILVVSGPGIKRDELVHGATILDVTPTTLALLGLPVGDDMDGRVLEDLFETAPVAARIPSWEQVPGECGAHPPDLRVDPAASDALIKQFVALGYIEPPGEQREAARAATLREARYDLAVSRLDENRPDLAVPLLEEIATEAPRERRFLLTLTRCYLLLGRYQEARAAVKPLLSDHHSQSTPEGEAPLDRLGSDAEGEIPRPGSGPPRPWAHCLMGLTELAAGNTEAGIEWLRRAETAEADAPGLYVQIGRAYFGRGRLEDAERALARALRTEADNSAALTGLAAVRLRQRRFEEAASAALAALGSDYSLSRAHLLLGIASARLGLRQRAVRAFETALSFSPGLAGARRWLAALQIRQAGSPATAAERLLALRKPPPRISPTSPTKPLGGAGASGRASPAAGGDP